jgi:Tfp pilus assembly pilus retraction ATPase PilT
MDEEWYVIKNMKDFVNQTRILVFNSFGSTKPENDMDALMDSLKPEDQDELDNILSYDESVVMTKDLAKKQKNKKTKKIRYLITDDIYHNIIKSFNDRMVSNLLNSLVNKGLVETAFDEKTNDFMFWIKDENKELPETD